MPVNAGGGWAAILYTLKQSRRAGGYLRMYRALRSRNACKTCALGMGGQLGGMVNEQKRFPEVCKKSVQAMAADMAGAIRDDFFSDFPIEKLKRLTPRELEHAGRITKPLLLAPGANRYIEITWEDALARIADKLREIAPDKSFFYFSGRSSNEAGFLLQLFARLYGTNNVNNCSYYCHQASGVGLTAVTGSSTATVTLEDLDHCDLIFLVGANPASNHPRFMRNLMDLRRRGGSIVVINPLKEVGLVRFKVPSDVRSLFFGTNIASEYIQPNIGADIPLLFAIAKRIEEIGATDPIFLRDCAQGADEFLEYLRALNWEELVAQSGVPRETVNRVAQLYAESKNTIFCWAMGLTHHTHGVENIQAIANLAMLRGMLGRPGAGLLPLRGHSNVQGIGSVGVTPKLKDAIFEKLESEFNLALPTTPGMDTLACIRRADEGAVRFALCLGGNLYGSNPDAGFAKRAMNKIDLTVYLSTTLNTGHAHGVGAETIILPVLARDEEPQSTTQESMFNYVRLSDGGPSRYPGPRAEVEVIADIATRVLKNTTPIDWRLMRDHANIRAAISKVIPGYEKIGAIDETKEEFQITGRTFHSPRFKTDSGKAKFHTFDPPKHKPLLANQLRLMTIRSEGQFNTVVYEENDRYRNQTRRDVIMMNIADIEHMGLEIGDRVTISTDVGELADIIVRAFDVPAGNAAMYYPEANVLIPLAADEKSRTPAFKHTIVRIAKSSALPVIGGS